MSTEQLTYESVIKALPSIVADCIGVDEADVVPSASFRTDLGGESIDDLDLSFRCEKAFGVRKPLQPLFDLGVNSVDVDGTLSPAAVAAAAERWPFLVSALQKVGDARMHIDDLENIYTIDLIARLILAAAEVENSNE